MSSAQGAHNAVSCEAGYALAGPAPYRVEPRGSPGSSQKSAVDRVGARPQGPPADEYGQTDLLQLRRGDVG